MAKIKVKKIIYLLIWFVVPLIFFVIHIELISIEKEREIDTSRFKVEGTAKDIPDNKFDSAMNVSYELEDDIIMENSLDVISRYSYLLGIQPDIIRHVFILKHNITTEIFYSELDDHQGENIQSETFEFILSCDGKKIETGKEGEINRGLKLSDQLDNDRDYVENIIKSCQYIIKGGSRNDMGRSVLVHDVRFLPLKAEIILLLKPDFISKVFIFLGWYIFIFGFFILVKEGPLKILGKQKKGRNKKKF